MVGNKTAKQPHKDRVEFTAVNNLSMAWQKAGYSHQRTDMVKTKVVNSCTMA